MNKIKEGKREGQQGDRESKEGRKGGRKEGKKGIGDHEAVQPLSVLDDLAEASDGRY